MARSETFLNIRTTIELGLQDHERVLIATTPDCPAPGYIYSHRVVIHRKLTWTVKTKDTGQALIKHAELLKMAPKLYKEVTEKGKPDENSTPRP